MCLTRTAYAHDINHINYIYNTLNGQMCVCVVIQRTTVIGVDIDIDFRPRRVADIRCRSLLDVIFIWSIYDYNDNWYAEDTAITLQYM